MFKKIKDCIESVKKILSHVFKIEAYIHSIKGKLDVIQSDVVMIQNALMIKNEEVEDSDIFRSFKDLMASFINNNALIVEGGEVKGLGVVKSFGIIATHTFNETSQEYTVTYKRYVAINNVNELGVKIINITDKTEIKHC